MSETTEAASGDAQSTPNSVVRNLTTAPTRDERHVVDRDGNSLCGEINHIIARGQPTTADEVARLTASVCERDDTCRKCEQAFLSMLFAR